MMPRLLCLLAPAITACAVEPASPALGGVHQAVTLTQVTSFGSNPGALRMFEFVPSGLPPGSPLVVALHGCTESASSYSTQTEWGNLAQRFGFAVVFAEQPSANNILSCFNWFQPEDITRDRGEALSIKQMVDTMKASHAVDPARVFVTGMSAGGYMTEVMMAAYPDVFAGGAVNSGGAYACATTLADTTACQQGNVNRTPQQWGNLVRNAFPGHSGPYPRLIVFHGSIDATVAPANRQQSVDQWSNVLGIDEIADLSEAFRTANHQVFRDAGGRAMIESYLVNNMGHALTVDPGPAADQGGTTGAFSEDHDIYSSFYAAQFFGLAGGGGTGADTTPPTVAIASPQDGATVSGALAVAVSASDSVGVARVELRVDGALVATDSSAPFAFTVDTTTLSNASHALAATAFDAAGNSRAAQVTVTVQNAGGGGGTHLETFSSPAGPDNAGWTFGAWSLSARDATGVTGSRSVTATAAPRFGTATQTATWAGLALGTAPRLSYARQLTLSDANVTASAGFRVIINDGTDHVVDARDISGFGSFSESSFTTRANLDLSGFAGKTVTLKLVVTATDLLSTLTSARATVDQIQIQ